MAYKCDFCNAYLNSVSSLNYHKKNNKKCLEIQTQTLGSTDSALVNCEFCGKSFASSKRSRHLEICKEKEKQENERLKNEIEELKNKDTEKLRNEIEDLRNKYHAIHNNIMNNNIMNNNNNNLNNNNLNNNNLNNNNNNLNIEKVLTLNTNNSLVLNGIDIIVRPSDGYINLTQLCKAGGKEFKHYKENKNADKFLKSLSSSVRIPTDDLIKYETGSNENRATWGHRLVAIEIARWISPEFGVQVNRYLDNILFNNLNKEDLSFVLTLQNGEKMNISIREDGYVNATQLCKAGGKLFSDYHKTKQTQEYLEALKSVMNIPITELINIKQGGSNQGTYVHRKVAYHLAQWISPHFSVQVSNVLDQMFITGKVVLGEEKSNKELENMYQEKIDMLNNKLKNYETNVFNNVIDVCPIQYFGKDIVYFLKFEIPSELKSKYITEYKNIDDQNYNCVEFGVSSDFEERLKSHKRDKKKNNLIFLYAIELNKRYIASKVEKYIKTIIKQMNVNFDYEKKKECFIAREEEFNIIINRIKDGLENIDNVENIEDENFETEEIEEDDDTEYNYTEYYDRETDRIKYKYKVEKDVKIKKIEAEIEKDKFQTITELFKNKLISIDDYKYMIGL